MLLSGHHVGTGNYTQNLKMQQIGCIALKNWQQLQNASFSKLSIAQTIDYIKLFFISHRK